MKLVAILFVLLCLQNLHAQEYVHFLGSDYQTIREEVEESNVITESTSNESLDGQRISTLRLSIDNNDSFFREVTLLFISEICVSQLYKLHFEKGKNLITMLDNTLVKSVNEEYTWIKPKKHVDFMYQIKKIPPDHVLKVWLDVGHSL